MNSLRVLTLFAILLLPNFALANTDIVFPKDSDLKIELVLESPNKSDTKFSVAGKLVIKNTSSQAIRIHHPNNRQVLTFFVTDGYGNVVTPIGNAKVDPLARYIELKPDASFEYKFERLWFLTGTARFGYKFEVGKKYRVIASYRPAGSNGPGFSSQEIGLE